VSFFILISLIDCALGVPKITFDEKALGDNLKITQNVFQSVVKEIDAANMLLAQIQGTKLVGKASHLGHSKRIYETWFGEYDHVTASEVKKVFNNVDKGSYTVTHGDQVDCDDPARDYAVVWNKEHGPPCVIHVCPKFYKSVKSGHSGDASKEGRVETIVHEMTHCHGTDDIDGGYGTEDAMEMALNDPENARKNADNYCYFAHFAHNDRQWVKDKHPHSK
jgi:hypothetical protein